MNNLPPGANDADTDGPICRQCGQCGCGCKDDGDLRSYRQRVADEKAEHRMELERELHDH